MAPADKDFILSEIRRTARENAGKPLGRQRFCQATGITMYEITRHWPRFGDAVEEAGLAANALLVALPDEVLFKALIKLIRELGAIPTFAQLRMARVRHPDVPSTGAFERLGNKNERIGKLLAYCQSQEGYDDVIAVCAAACSPQATEEDRDQGGSATGSYGFVYLARGHGGAYKIGRTNLVDRRMAELGTQGPAELELIHHIKTDDPVGVEAYWHRRFEKSGKRMRGEWFRLDRSDIASFKRWRRIA